MRILHIVAAAFLAAHPVAQVFTFPVDPRSTYLRTANDAPLPPLAVPLAALGAGPGQWLRVASTGAYSYAPGQPDDYRSLIGSFSSSGAVLPESGFAHRLPDAVAAGPRIATGPSFWGSLPTDVPEDFVISHPLWTDHTFVEVPPNATHLIVGTHDSYFADNTDPNADFGLVVTLIATPTLPGTGEHLVLRSGIGVPAASGPSVHVAPAGATMAVEMEYLTGMIPGSIYLFVADTAPTGAAVPPLLPRLWVQNLLIVHWGVLVNSPGFTDSWSLVAPPGFTGTSLRVQAGALSSVARNGLYLTTDAHQFVLQ